MLSAITLGSLASSPMILSAGGQDEQPCEVKSSTTARGSAASAGRMIATIAQTPKAPDQRAPDQREIELQAIIAIITQDREVVGANSRRSHLTEHEAKALSYKSTELCGFRTEEKQPFFRLPSPASLLTSR